MRTWRMSTWSGAAIGVAAAAVLTWLLREGVETFFASARLARDGGTFAGSGWLGFALGAVVAAVVFGAQFHPLISAVPAAWFLILFGPSLFGVVGAPDWYPDWMRSYVPRLLSVAVFVVTGLLVAVTLKVYVWSRPRSSGSTAIDVEEVSR